LLRTGTESVDGNRCVHFDLGHGLGSYRSMWALEVLQVGGFLL
jgi:hypothetical protein